MTTYKEIQGTAVQSLSSSTGTVIGQIWYDTANGVFKIEVDVGGTKTSKTITTT